MRDRRSDRTVGHVDLEDPVDLPVIGELERDVYLEEIATGLGHIVTVCPGFVGCRDEFGIDLSVQGLLVTLHSFGNACRSEICCRSR